MLIKRLTNQRLFSKGRGFPNEIGRMENVDLKGRTIRTENGISSFKAPASILSFFVKAYMGKKEIQIELTEYIHGLKNPKYSMRIEYVS